MLGLEAFIVEFESGHIWVAGIAEPPEALLGETASADR
jgi:hypothetical protein